jgi:hypothetical protein
MRDTSKSLSIPTWSTPFLKKILFKLVEGGITNKKFKPVLVVGCC